MNDAFNRNLTRKPPGLQTVDEFEADVDEGIAWRTSAAPFKAEWLVHEMAQQFMQKRDNGLPPTGEGLQAWQTHIANFAKAAVLEGLAAADKMRDVAIARFTAYREKYPLPVVADAPPEEPKPETLADAAEALSAELRKGKKP